MLVNDRSERMIFILNGLSGSGKTYQALLKKERNLQANVPTVHIELNKYLARHLNMQDSHERYFNEFIGALRNEIPIIILDKPNLLSKHRKNYERIAFAFEYKFVNIVIGGFDPDFVEFCHSRSTLPLEMLREQALSFQEPEGRLTYTISKEDCGWNPSWRQQVREGKSI